MKPSENDNKTLKIQQQKDQLRLQQLAQQIEKLQSGLTHKEGIDEISEPVENRDACEQKEVEKTETSNPTETLNIQTYYTQVDSVIAAQNQQQLNLKPLIESQDLVKPTSSYKRIQKKIVTTNKETQTEMSAPKLTREDILTEQSRKISWGRIFYAGSNMLSIPLALVGFVMALINPVGGAAFLTVMCIMTAAAVFYTLMSTIRAAQVGYFSVTNTRYVLDETNDMVQQPISIENNDVSAIQTVLHKRRKPIPDFEKMEDASITSDTKPIEEESDEDDNHDERAPDEAASLL